MTRFTVNGNPTQYELAADTPLLWALREASNLTGTKFGCGAALCGACTVHLDGQPVRSCSTPIAEAEGKAITTIEGIAGPEGELSKVQQAWISEQVPQCGYCQTGMMLQAVDVLTARPDLPDGEMAAAMDAVACRCGSHPRVIPAMRRAAGRMGEEKP